MDFQDTPEETAFRSQVRDFIEQNLPSDWTPPVGGPGAIYDDPERAEFMKVWRKSLAQRGWIAPHWPKEYGGAGMSPGEQFIFNEEMARHRAPAEGGMGVQMIGPTLILYGTDEQKKEHLPGITSGEVTWCQGYSEPGAGSDLAALQTRAVRDGDDYILNGQKIWTSGGHRANQMFCLVRTDPDAPKHRGISFLLIDDIKNTPGLTIRPLINMADRHHFNEVFFEDVRVPARNLIGEENRGWYVGMTLLDFERSGIGTTAGQRRTLEELTKVLKDGPADRREKYRTRLADFVVANNVGKYLGYRIGWMQSNGTHPNYEASVIKIYQSELGQRIYNFGLNVLGLSGQLRPEDPKAPLSGGLPENYLTSVPSTIYSGTNEIQRNIIATRGLGLPRG
ncbi:MAG TPA: acyl-CoA dehydrogenase family protein [Fimbriimonas sp.]